MSNEFDLERAKAGEPIERLWRGEWMKANFIGLSLTHGDPIVEIWDKVIGAWDCPSRSPKQTLRMAPKKVKVRYRVALLDGGTQTADSDEEVIDMQCGVYGEFKQWLTDWIETEVTE